VIQSFKFIQQKITFHNIFLFTIKTIISQMKMVNDSREIAKIETVHEKENG